MIIIITTTTAAAAGVVVDHGLVDVIGGVVWVQVMEGRAETPHKTGEHVVDTERGITVEMAVQ